MIGDSIESPFSNIQYKRSIIMKKSVFILAMTLPLLALGQTQDLPQSVRNSFNSEFPNQVITSWTDNGDYNYSNDWNDDYYYGDYNFDGYPDEFGYSNDFFEYDVPETYSIPSYRRPTQYQVFFNYNGIMMTAIYKPDGRFIISKGRADRLPTKVETALMDAFKGKKFRVSRNIEEMITPKYSKLNPVYRFKVNIRHADKHIVKIDSKGNVISDNKLN